MTPGAVIFDCDGTLVDSEALGNEVLLALAVEHGVPLTATQAIMSFRGGRMADYVAKLEALHGGPLPETFIPEFRRRAKVAFATSLRPVAGAAAMLGVLATRLPLAVASNGPREKTVANLATTGLLHFFAERIFSAYDSGAWKPDPAVFLLAASALGFAPSVCVVVEDSIPGVTAGLAAGMRVVAYVPHGMEDDLPEGVTIIRHLHELPGLLSAG